MFWHHSEFAREELSWVKGSLGEAEGFLVRFDKMASVRFSTAKEAVYGWKDHYH
jgi:hypothetical protein